MKKFPLLVLLLVSALTIFAQQKPLLPDPVKDKKEKNGYTIQLKMALGNTVLFDLYQAGKPVFSQPMNPVTMLPQGFDRKQDAFRVAEWMIDQYGKEGRFPPVVPPGVAGRFNIKNKGLHVSPIKQ